MESEFPDLSCKQMPPAHPFDDDKLKEECGVFGVIGVADAANFVGLDCTRCSIADKRPVVLWRMTQMQGSIRPDVLDMCAITLHPNP